MGGFTPTDRAYAVMHAYGSTIHIFAFHTPQGKSRDMSTQAFFFFLKWVKELRQKSVIIYLSTCVCVHVQSVLPLSRDKRISSLSTSQTPTLWFCCCSIYLAVHAFACLTVRWSKGKGHRGSCGETVANYLQHRRNPRNIDFQLAEPGLLRQ